MFKLFFLFFLPGLSLGPDLYISITIPVGQQLLWLPLLYCSALLCFNHLYKIKMQSLSAT